MKRTERERQLILLGTLLIAVEFSAVAAVVYVVVHFVRKYW